MLQKIGFRDLIEKNEYLPQSGSNCDYKTSIIIEGFITSIWCGANRFLNTEVTPHHTALGKIFNWEKTQIFLSTLRYRTVAMGSYFEKLNGKLVLKIAFSKKRRSWFSGPWNYSKVFDDPFEFSNV